MKGYTAPSLIDVFIKDLDLINMQTNKGSEMNQVTIDEIVEAFRYASASIGNPHWDMLANAIIAHGIAPPEGFCIVPIATLKHWRELADLNPKDLAPRIDAYLKETK